MQTLVSTENKFENLNISIQAGIGQGKQGDKDLLEDLINIKYMHLQELKLSIEMGRVTDKHVILIAEALEKNKNMKNLSLNLWKYFLYHSATRSRQWDSKRFLKPSRAIYSNSRFLSSTFPATKSESTTLFRSFSILLLSKN